jgi:hypothetical protein
LFVKQTIQEARETYPNLEEQDISLDAIMSRIIEYTGFENYHVFYFEIPAEHLKPNLNLASMGKTKKIHGKSVKFQLVEADLIAPEMADFFIQNQSRFAHTVLVADDIIYSTWIGESGNYPNLTVFRRREPETRMLWDFYDRYAYFEDLILEICKEIPRSNHQNQPASCFRKTAF